MSRKKYPPHPCIPAKFNHATFAAFRRLNIYDWEEGADTGVPDDLQDLSHSISVKIDTQNSFTWHYTRYPAGVRDDDAAFTDNKFEHYFDELILDNPSDFVKQIAVNVKDMLHFRNPLGFSEIATLPPIIVTASYPKAAIWHKDMALDDYLDAEEPCFHILIPGDVSAKKRDKVIQNTVERLDLFVDNSQILGDKIYKCPAQMSREQLDQGRDTRDRLVYQRKINGRQY